MKMRVFFVFAALAAACSPPKFVAYRSVAGDFAASVPYGWNVITESEGGAFSQVSFIGPFDPDFYLGAPSLSVRWYKNYRPRRLRDGRLEMYAGGDDFARQTLHQVYGDGSVLYGIGSREDGGREILRAPERIVLRDSGLEATFFGVLSPAPAPAANRWGVDKGADGRPVNIRLHDYAVIPLEGGFYVLCYPATLRGYGKDAELFRTLLNTFHPYAAGPGGLRIRLPARAALPKS